MTIPMFPVGTTARSIAAARALETDSEVLLCERDRDDGFEMARH